MHVHLSATADMDTGQVTQGRNKDFGRGPRKKNFTPPDDRSRRRPCGVGVSAGGGRYHTISKLYIPFLKQRLNLSSVDLSAFFKCSF